MSTNGDKDILPEEFRASIESRLTPGEIPLFCFEFDLDSHLRYYRGLVVLTDHRILEISGSECRTWSLDEIDSIRVIDDRSGVGSVDLLGRGRLLTSWRYTAGRSQQAHRLAAQFERIQHGKTIIIKEAEEPPTTVCAGCGAILAADQKTCPDCGSVKGKPAIGAIYRLSRFARPHKWMLLLGFLLMVSSSLTALAPPYFVKLLIDDVLTPAENLPGSIPFYWVWLFLAAYVGASILAWLLMWGRTYVMAWVSERIAADLRDQTYSHMQQLSLEFFGGKRTGDLVSRISTDTDRICYFLQVYLLDFANNILMLCFTASFLLVINSRLALATLLPLPIIVSLVYWVRNKMRRGFALGTRAWGEMNSVLADTIPGIRVVKAFAQEQREIQRFRVANERVFWANCRVNTLWSFFEPVVALLTALGLAVVWGYGAGRVFAGEIKVGGLYLFVTYISNFYGRMDSMSRFVAAVQRAGASVQRIFAILDRVPSVAEPAKPVHPGRLRGEVEFRNVGFNYGSRPVLKDITFKVEPGEMVGLVGPSGAGKSTIVNLVCRFYDVSEGAILVDGIDIRSFFLTEYRSNIGIVLQEPFLFYGTIAENIAYGRPNATRAEIIAAARAAHAHEFILRLPDGYDSVVGERGQFLSGGERQRISIARALLIDPAILILDEATSSVDTETEREIQLALENLIKGRTTIAIAHRLSTLHRADRLVVIENGQITEIGPHDELIQKGGTYARLYQAQLEMNRQRTALTD